MTGASVRQIWGFDGGANWVEFSHDGEYVVTRRAADEPISVSKVRYSAQPTKFSGAEMCCEHASFSPDGKRIVGAGFDSTVTIFDVATGKGLLTLGQPSRDGHSGRAFAYFTADGTRIVSVHHDVTRIWEY
jgi:WD40 repeat protein